jgi:fatty-acyl-CoA synthase
MEPEQGNFVVNQADTETARIATHGAAGVNLGYVIAQRARRTPSAPAIVTDGAVLTYQALDRRANRLANALQGRGVGHGDRVAVLLTNCPEFFEVLFGCAKLGARLVTINYRLVADEVRFILASSGARVLIHGADMSDTARAATDARVERVVVGEQTDGTALPYESLIEGASPMAPGVEVGLSDDAAVIYTSGTTGRPKGAVLTHGNLLHTSLNQVIDFAIVATDRTLVAAPLYHVGGMLVLTLPTLHVGGTVYLHRAFRADEVLAAFERERITTAFLAPTMWKMLLGEPDVTERDLSSLRLCVSGGESLPIASIRELVAVFGRGFAEGYGLTEAASSTTVLRPEDVLRKPGSVGLPLIHNAVRVVGDDGHDVEPGRAGEIWQSGPTVMRGYWEQPEATAKVLRDGWLRTGDIGRTDEDGYLYIVDRANDMIISGAENVYPAEVEQALYRHPAIEEAAVIGLPDEQWGEIVTAVVVPRAGSELTELDVIEHCRPIMAGFKRPRRVHFTDALPRNPSGKVRKGELRKAYSVTP